MARIAITTTTLIIQHIRIAWTKTARGGSLAERRNQIANAFRLPEPPANHDNRDRYIVHRIDFGEHNEFAEPSRQKITFPSIDIPFRARNCTVEIKGGTPQITYEWRDGAPRRQYIDISGTQVPATKSYTIADGQWGRVEYNARFSCIDFGMWSYEHEIINVAYSIPDCRELFLSTEPAFNCRELEHLW